MAEAKDDHAHGEIDTLLDRLGLATCAYAEAFRREGVETLADLKTAVTEAVLKGLGMPASHRERMVAAAEALRAGRDVPSYPAVENGVPAPKRPAPVSTGADAPTQSSKRRRITAAAPRDPGQTRGPARGNGMIVARERRLKYCKAE